MSFDSGDGDRGNGKRRRGITGGSGRGRSEGSSKQWFKPRQSGNSGGRPPGSKNKPKEVPNTDLRAMILKEASRPITLNDAKGPVTLTMFEMAYRGLGFQAGKGSVRAQRDYVDVALRAARDEAEERASNFLAIGEAMFEFDRVRREHKARGRKPPAYVLDPDSFIIGPEGILGFRDAPTEEDKARWERQRAKRQEELSDLQRELEGAKGRKRAGLREEIAFAEQMLEHLENALAGSRRAMWILDQGDLSGEKE